MTISDSPTMSYPRDTIGPWAFLDVPFETSLLIEWTHSSTSTTGYATVTWGER
jgi:hypothetical protein